MDWLILLAAKSLLIAGGALILLKLLRNRSAADRSWIAHLALGALLLLPIASYVLPSLSVAGPEFLVGSGETASPVTAPVNSTEEAVAPSAESAVTASSDVPGAPIDWPFWAYFVPAGLLLLLTIAALIRLFVLKARARVLVDAPWLTALARAQSRMGFKHGTALLTSNELPSPISWGVVRPVILLNTEASQSTDEAEAIITHELAHVANLDWAKLMIARVATALFWFNPLVWLLAREAHQLREEAADDAVLATDIEDTEYARLLVGVARHECRGLLIGAHGVAPARNSLARRVKRVLDGAVKRAPGGWRWGSAAAFFAAGMAVPVAALNLVPASSAATADDPYYADVAATAGAEAIADAAEAEGGTPLVMRNSEGGTITTQPNGRTVMVSPSGNVIEIFPPDANGRRRTIMRNSNGNVLDLPDGGSVPSVATAIAHAVPPIPPIPSRPRSAVDQAIELKAVGATPEYVAAIRSAAPQLRMDGDEIVGMKAVGVTPEFVRELARLGYRDLNADDITGAYAVGVRPDYLRSLAKVGYGRISLEQLTELRAVGVTPTDIERYRRAGFGNLDVDKLVELKALGITPEELRASANSGP